MELFQEKMWLWAHPAGSHDGFGIPRKSRMSQLEGAMYLGIPNICSVVFGGNPKPPFDRHALAFDCLDKVVWSIIGDYSSKRNEETGTDCAAVGQMAKTHSNVVGAIMDDFLSESARRKLYPPESLANFKKIMCTEAGRPLPLWVVVYTAANSYDDAIVPYLDECDVATLWTWNANDIPSLSESFTKFRQIYGSTKPLYGGCYLFDYSNRRPMPTDLLQYQLDTYYGWMKEGQLDGVIFCSNNVCDVGLEAPIIVKNWIAAHKDEVFN